MLGEAGLKVKRDKCKFGNAWLEYLGHMVCGGKVAVLRTYKQPTTKKEMHTFLGLASYYRRFVPDLAKFSTFLSPAVSKKAPSKVTWTLGMADAFYHFKEAVASASELVIPVCGDCFVLQMHQARGGRCHTQCCERWGELTTAFFSRQLQGGSETL